MIALVTGVTGYIGGRLVPSLLEEGHEVRVFVRDLKRLRDRSWAKRVKVFEGDIEDIDAVRSAIRGVDAVYYLVHALSAGDEVPEADLRAANAFTEAARGVRQVIYLGRICPHDGANQNAGHVRARADVGEILRATLPTTEIRAGPIIGSGSASFEMVRYMTERVPIMVAPSWIRNPVRPIGVKDVVRRSAGRTRWESSRSAPSPSRSGR